MKERWPTDKKLLMMIRKERQGKAKQSSSVTCQCNQPAKTMKWDKLELSNILWSDHQVMSTNHILWSLYTC